MKKMNTESNIPHMPEYMKRMVEAEVENQLSQTSSSHSQKTNCNTARFTRRTLIAVLVAVLAFGTTVFAGVRWYQMQVDQVNTYGASTKVEVISETTLQPACTAQDTTPVANIPIPSAIYQLTYLPSGMVEHEPGKYSYESDPCNGGISLAFYGMDTGDNQFEVFDRNVVSKENLTLNNGHTGVYLELTSKDSISADFNQKIYISYPELHYVLEMFIGENVSKEDALKTAEGLTLTETNNASDPHCIFYYKWSDYLTSRKTDSEECAPDFMLTATKEQMKNMHKIGETFHQLESANAGKDLTLSVAEVSYLDNFASLDTTNMQSDLKNALDSNNRLKKTTLQYVKSGDGLNSIDEVIKEKEVAQKLAYITLNCTNEGTTTMTDVLVTAALIRVNEQDGQFHIYEGERPTDSDTWDKIENSGLSQYFTVMEYFDVDGIAQVKNYIPSLAPGESATVHVGFIVSEEDIPYLLLNLENMGACFEFSQEAFDLGYVDLRH